MNWQKFIGISMAVLAGSQLDKMYSLDWSGFVCIMLIGLGGVIYGDA